MEFNINEWQEIYDVKILKINNDFKDIKWYTYITQEEFGKILTYSTIEPGKYYSPLKDKFIVIYKVYVDGNWCAFDEISGALQMVDTAIDEYEEVLIKKTLMWSKEFEELPEFEG